MSGTLPSRFEQCDPRRAARRLAQRPLQNANANDRETHGNSRNALGANCMRPAGSLQPMCNVHAAVLCLGILQRTVLSVERHLEASRAPPLEGRAAPLHAPGPPPWNCSKQLFSESHACHAVGLAQALSLAPSSEPAKLLIPAQLATRTRPGSCSAPRSKQGVNSNACPDHGCVTAVLT